MADAAGANNSAPRRMPLACGALGAYDPDLVTRIARRLAPEVEVVHSGSRSCLALDRPPIRWRSALRRGLAWTELARRPQDSEAGSWREIATSGAACGLAWSGGRPFVHSSVSGVGGLYFLEREGAVYFSSRIDPLLAAAPPRLTLDWEAWAAILSLGHPLGDRTPFFEVRRLGPFARLECRRGRARVSEERWPWAEVEPSASVEHVVDDLVELFGSELEALPPGPIACMLSGGWDSRVLAGLLAKRRREETVALTTSNDDGFDHEERLAAAVAALLDLDHEVLVGEPGGYWRDFLWWCDRTDYQRATNPWLAPLVTRLSEASVSVDGLAIDALAQPGGRYITWAAIEAGGGPEGPPELWRRLVAVRAPLPYERPLTRALRATARRQLISESRRYEGHLARLTLTSYRNRTVRGVALNPSAALGSAAKVAMPGTADPVVRALLSASPRAKFGSRVHRGLLHAIDPRLAELPSTNEKLPPAPRTRPTRRWSPAALEAFSATVLGSPLAPHLNKGARRRLTRHERGRPPGVPGGILPPAVFALWFGRYRDRLREADPADLLR